MRRWAFPVHLGADWLQCPQFLRRARPQWGWVVPALRREERMWGGRWERQEKRGTCRAGGPVHDTKRGGTW